MLLQTHLMALNLQVAENPTASDEDLAAMLQDKYIVFKWERDLGWGYGKVVTHSQNPRFNVEVHHKGDTGPRPHLLRVANHQFQDSAPAGSWAVLVPIVNK